MDKANNVKRFILINTNSIYCRQRFTACHELYHLLFQEKFTVSYDVEDVNNQDKDNEEHFADYFARCLLLPKDGIWQLIPESEYKTDAISLATILKIEQNYRCSRSCLLLRLKEMGVISETVLESFSQNVVRGAAEYGYPTDLYFPTGSKELIGDYNVKARQLYDQGLISQAKYFSLLKDMGIELRKESCDGQSEGYHPWDDTRKEEVDEWLSKSKAEKIDFPRQSMILTEYYRLKHEHKRYGDGECACMAMAKYGKETIASSNFRDVADYCDANGIEYIGVLDILQIALNKGIWDVEKCNQFIHDAVIINQARFPVDSIEDYKPTIDLCGFQSGILEIAKKMKTAGMDVDTICEMTGVKKEEKEEIERM